MPDIKTSKLLRGKCWDAYLINTQPLYPAHSFFMILYRYYTSVFIL